MNHLILDVEPVIVWDGSASTPFDIRKHLYFSFAFTPTTDLADGDVAVFEVQYADPSAADKCVPGSFAAIPEVAICGAPATPADVSQIAIRGPLAAGTICNATIPCGGPGFLRVVAASGVANNQAANVNVIGLRKGFTGWR